MILKILFVQMKCRYPGEHAMEARAVVDEITLDESPSVLEDLTETLVDDSLDSWAWVTIEVPEEAVKAQLFPKQEPIQGDVKN